MTGPTRASPSPSQLLQSQTCECVADITCEITRFPMLKSERSYHEHKVENVETKCDGTISGQNSTVTYAEFY